MWRIAAQVAVGIVAYCIGADLSNSIASLSYQSRVLVTPSLLRKFITHIDPNWIRYQGDLLRPQRGSYLNDVLYWSTCHRKSVALVCPFMVLLLTALCWLSYLLHPYALAMSIVVFVAGLLVPIRKQAKHTVLGDIQMVLLCLYVWNGADKAQCEREVLGRAPRLRNALELIREIADSSYTS